MKDVTCVLRSRQPAANVLWVFRHAVLTPTQKVSCCVNPAGHTSPGSVALEGVSAGALTIGNLLQRCRSQDMMSSKSCGLPCPVLRFGSRCPGDKQIGPVAYKVHAVLIHLLLPVLYGSSVAEPSRPAGFWWMSPSRLPHARQLAGSHFCYARSTAAHAQHCHAAVLTYYGTLTSLDADPQAAGRDRGRRAARSLRGPADDDDAA